jgi:hypothetical protein
MLLRDLSETENADGLFYGVILLAEGTRATHKPDPQSCANTGKTLLQPVSEAVSLFSFSGNYREEEGICIFENISTFFLLYFPFLYCSVHLSPGLKNAGLSKSRVPASLIFLTIHLK